MNARKVTRRSILGGLAATPVVAGLAGCDNERSGAAGSQAGDGPAELPTHVPFGGPEPDLPAGEGGVTAGFFTYPKPPIRRDGFPLAKTEPVTGLFQGIAPALPPDRNPVYQRIFGKVGNQLSGDVVLSTSYIEKFQVTIAGGDLPDLVQIEPAPHLPDLLEKYFTDLSEVIAGDGITQYPALASFTPENWQVSTLNGRIWGVPQPRTPAGRMMMTRGDILADKGIDTDPQVSDGDDFVAMLAELTDESRSQFAIAGDPTNWLLQCLREMCGAPNGWAEADGAFVSDIEAPETLEALEQAGRIVRAGYTHPEAFSKPGENATWFRSGVTPLLLQGFTKWGSFAQMDPEFDIGHVRLPRWTGGGQAEIHTSLAGYYAYVGIRKQDDPTRVDEILRILDYIASPFGTEEYLDITYGIEGETYTMEDGDPKPIEGKSADLFAGWTYAGAGSQNVLYIPGNEELVTRQHDYLSSALPEGRGDASVGLYSPTALGKAASWGKRRKDLERSILLGEASVSSWEDFAKSWREDVGASMAEEFAEAAAEQD